MHLVSLHYLNLIEKVHLVGIVGLVTTTPVVHALPPSSPRPAYRNAAIKALTFIAIEQNSFALTTRTPLDNTYPAVGRLIHVTLNLPSVTHQVFHAPIFQGCWVRSGEDCLYTVVKRYCIQYSSWWNNIFYMLQLYHNTKLPLLRDSLTVCGQDGFEDPESRVHARLFSPLL